MHQALYRKYRPQTFDDVYGQDHITSVLKYEVANNKVSHAYLFCGSRGTGKTTCAKILAKAANCLNPKDGDPCGECEACRAIADEATVDILEMDAASNTGVDYIRDIRDAVVYSPAMLKTRVYIIDEVHMLSTSAFNALLKTLEEPPEKVIFILATTEVHKIPITVTSRCQRFDFRRIRTDVIADRLKYIANNESITLKDDAATLIGKLSNGGMRDAISLLEVSAGQNHEVNIPRVRACAGISGRENIINTVKAIATKDWDTLFSVISDLVASSMNISVFWQDLIAFYRDMMLAKATKNALNNYELTEDEIAETKECASLLTLETIMYHSRLLDRALGEMQSKTCDQRICAELTLVRMSEGKLATDTEALLSRISELEGKVNMLSAQLKGGNVTVIEAKEPEPAPTEVNPEPVKEEKKAEPQPTAPADGIREVEDWAEILRKIEDKDPSCTAFLAQTQSCIMGNEFIIKVADAFGVMMLDTPDNRKTITEAMVQTNPDYAVLNLKIAEDKKVKKPTASPFDEINF